MTSPLVIFSSSSAESAGHKSPQSLLILENVRDASLISCIHAHIVFFQWHVHFSQNLFTIYQTLAYTALKSPNIVANNLKTGSKRQTLVKWRHTPRHLDHRRLRHLRPPQFLWPPQFRIPQCLGCKWSSNWWLASDEQGSAWREPDS